ncbi:PEP-CTERM system TPR-repeat protein PrsT [Paucibacter sp. O1-1]|nr:PEP-CTERM system TPR-repeat protein PrsT [Paucibacter sp. O1-1]MDA3827646.1 PEP-CTERM system TPR-repeat protein PrsT [Paucibacter sp. O1-1]
MPCASQTRSRSSQRWPQRRLAGLLLAGLSLVSQSCLANAGKAAAFYEDALSRYQRKDMAGAIIQLKNALQQDKNLLPVQVLLGRALLANGDAAGAEIAFGEALRLGVDRSEIALALAQSLAAQGKPGQVLERTELKPDGLPPALRQRMLLQYASAHADRGDIRAAFMVLEEARGIDRNNLEVWLLEVPLRVRARQLDEALKVAEGAVRLGPNSAEAHYQKGTVFHARGDIAAAMAAYDQALRVDAAHIDARLARVGVQIDQGRRKEAAIDLGKLLELAPEDPRGLYLKALLARSSGDIAASNAALNRVTSLLDPVPIEFIRYRPQILMLNGLAHFALNEYLKALPYLEAAHRAMGPSPLVKLLAQIYIDENKPERAAEVLEPYLRAQPADSQALAMYASVLVSQGRHAKATSMMQDALRGNDSAEFRTVLGLGLLQSGQTASGLAELEAALKKDPRQLQAGMALVSRHLGSRQFKKAGQIADQLVKHHPKNPSVWTLSGIAKQRAGDFAGARTAYQKALSLDAELLEPRLGLARVELASGKLTEADAQLKTLLKADERNADVLFEMATLSELRRQPEDALRWLERSVEGNGPGALKAQHALVAWHLRAGDAAAALAAAKRLLGRTPDDVKALNAYAQAQFLGGDIPGMRSTLTTAARKAGFDSGLLLSVAELQMTANDPNAAVYTLEKVLSTEPQSTRALAMNSSAELLRGDLVKAEKSARQVLQLQPRAAIGHNLMADIHMAREQPGPAQESLRRALELQPNSTHLLRLFRVLAAQDGGKPAIQLAEQWLKSKPGDLVVRKALGDAQARTGDFAAAQRSYEAALKLRPEDAEVLNNLANVQLRLDQPAAAVKTAEAALQQAPRNPLVIDTAGWAYHRLGQNERALQLLRDARLREPDNPEIRYHLGVVLAALGRKAEAREELQMALKGSLAADIRAAALPLLQTLK